MTGDKTEDARGLPEICAARLRDKSDGHVVGTPIFIRLDELGYFPAQDPHFDVDAWNREMGINLAQVEAMQFGSMFGWDTPGADVKTWQTASNVLRHASEKIERGWIQGALARDHAGQIVGPHSPDAVCWCAAGAITCVAVRLTGSEMGRYIHLEEMARALLCTHLGLRYSQTITVWNDSISRTKAEVVDAMRSAANQG